MSYHSRIVKPIIITIIAIAILVTSDHFLSNFFDGNVKAQSTAGIDFDLLNLRNRVNRLEGEVRSFNQPNYLRKTTTPNPTQSPNNLGNPPMINGQAIGRSDPLFERLATLLIELKEDVRNIDKRLTSLEKKAAK